MVVLFHLWPDRLTGGFAGVDVFFVISGYLITAHLLAKPPGSAADLGRFWNRRIRRLLPAALLVLAVTAVATRLVAPVTQWASTAKEIIASALYVQNWVLAASSVDYLAADNAASPVQHYWSLSVEEQFYLIWPLLVLAAFWFASKRMLSGKAVMRVAIIGVFAISLIISVAATAAEPASAYFITPTRMWELAAGGLAATFGSIAASKCGEAVAVPAAWLGIAAIVFTGLKYTSGTPFPGYTALLPVAGAALVIIAGSDHKASPTQILRLRPIQWLGDVSYSVYLWHWPLVVLVPFVSGGELGQLDKAAIAASTLVLAALSKKYVEDRFRRPGPKATLATAYKFAAAGMALIVVAGSMQIAAVQHRTDAAKQQLVSAVSDGDPCLGAAALVKGPKVCPVNNHSEMLPDPALAKTDKSDAYPDGCWSNSPYSDHKTCTYGSGPVQVALVGNSHAGHWLPALQVLAAQKGWTITTFLVSQCAPSNGRQTFDTPEKTQNCYDWGQWARARTQGKRFDLVITSERQSVPVVGHSLASSGPAAVRGYESYLQTWAHGGTNILILKDPTFPGKTVHNVPDCLAENPQNHAACSGSRKDWIVKDPLVEAAKKVNLPQVNYLNFDNLICAPDRCRGINGKVITYFDGSHLTATYARTMAPYMAAPIERVLDHR